MFLCILVLLGYDHYNAGTIKNQDEPDLLTRIQNQDGQNQSIFRQDDFFAPKLLLRKETDRSDVYFYCDDGKKVTLVCQRL